MVILVCGCFSGVGHFVRGPDTDKINKSPHRAVNPEVILCIFESDHTVSNAVKPRFVVNIFHNVVFVLFGH